VNSERTSAKTRQSLA